MGSFPHIYTTKIALRMVAGLRRCRRLRRTAAGSEIRLYLGALPEEHT